MFVTAWSRATNLWQCSTQRTEFRKGSLVAKHSTVGLSTGAAGPVLELRDHLLLIAAARLLVFMSCIADTLLVFF